jgi:PTS system cellobiose-specific IIC component
MLGGKFGNQRHMASIRDGFATFMPLIIVGALAALVNNVFIQPNSLLAN